MKKLQQTRKKLYTLANAINVSEEKRHWGQNKVTRVTCFSFGTFQIIQ